MVKYYCDCCSSLITSENACVGGGLHCPDSRLGITVERGGVELRVEIMTHLDGCANAGCFCRFCVLDALYALDTRKQKPKPKAVRI